MLALFALLPNLVKWVGAALTFVPSRLGLVQVVSPAEVIAVDISSSPSNVAITRAGEYALFTANYDLLSINEFVLAAKAKPWFKLADAAGNQVPVTLIERGLALYDTPFAPGRPVARFQVPLAGAYSMTHPRRPDFVYVVPDYTHGEEGAIGLYMLAQAVGLIAGGWYLRKRLRKRPTLVVVPPPSRLTRERFVAEQATTQDALPSTPARPWRAQPVPPPAAALELPVTDVRDVLLMVHQDELGMQAAETEVELLFLSQPTGAHGFTWGAKLGLAPFEAAGYSQGARVSDLVKLRYEGWPSACIKCGQPLEHLQLQWWFVRDQQGLPGLRHIECPPRRT